MNKNVMLLVLLMLVLAGTALVVAQSEDPTPAFGALSTLTPVPVNTDADVDPEATAEPVMEDASGADTRLAVCSAPRLPDFVPYIVREGDDLATLLAGVDNLTVTELAQLNCLDNPAAPPVGAVIWLPATSSAAASSTQPQMVEDTDSAPLILDLSIDETTVQNQEGVAFSWRAQGSAAFFYACPTVPDAACARPFQAQPLPLEVSLTIGDFQTAGQNRYRLEVVGADGESVTEDIAFEVVCSQAWIAPINMTTCPTDAPTAITGAWQPFENGFMIYFGDTDQIYVMTRDDQRVQVFADAFEEGLVEPELDVPEGRFAALRGFGIIWRELGGGDSPLGWALDQETGFQTARQPAGSVSYTTYVQGPGTTVYAVTFIPGEEAGFWSQVGE